MAYTPHVPDPSQISIPHQRPLVMVSVGTDHHPFDRLVDWMDGWAEDNPEVEVMIQRGTAAHTDHAESRELIPHQELCRLFGTALAVVAHGGPSTVMDARAAGRVPIVLPRNPNLGEHIDDHQMRFARHLHDKKLARLVTDVADLDSLLIEALVNPEAFLVSTEEGAVPGIVAFGRELDDLLGISTPMIPAKRKDNR